MTKCATESTSWSTKRQACAKCQRRRKIARIATQVLFITAKIVDTTCDKEREHERKGERRTTLHEEPAPHVEAGRKREETHSEILTKLIGGGAIATIPPNNAKIHGNT